MRLTIEGLGAEGDGIAHAGGRTAYVPFALPGEDVDTDAATLVVGHPSPHRIEPACRHFGACGGCTVQHLADAPYAEWKRGLVADALRRLGHDVPLAPMARTPPGARRRMDLAIRRDGATLRLGLHRRGGAEVVDMQECPVLHPALLALVAALRPVLRSMEGLRREGSAVVNLVDGGTDLLLRTDAALTAGDRARLAAMARAHGVTRVAWGLGARGAVEPAVTLDASTLAVSGRLVAVPPGAFLQASREGEAAIRAAVLAATPALKGRSVIVELFAGVGTLTHALAERAPVLAFEGDAAAVQALRGAGNVRVTAAQRDLVRQPVRVEELKRAGCVVLDPPFAGAGPQMAALAASGVPIVYVSCNPAALLRDGQALVAAGYRVAGAVAIDQFLWSARVEAVVGFVR